MTFKLSKHASARIQQRGYREPDLELLQEYGTPTKEGILMRKKDVREALQAETAEFEEKARRLKSLNGAYVVIIEGTVVTQYRTERRKQRHLLKTGR